jgi:transposase
LERIMWTPTTRAQHSREQLRYGSDLTDGEWAVVAPFLPAPAKTGRPRRWSMRELMNAIFYVLRSGCPWRMVPDCFPPATTVYRWFARLREEGVFAAMNHHLLMRDRNVGDARPTPEPRDADAAAHGKAFDARPAGQHTRHDFVTWDQRQLGLAELAVDHVQVDAADCAGHDARQDLARPRGALGRRAANKRLAAS